MFLLLVTKQYKSNNWLIPHLEGTFVERNSPGAGLLGVSCNIFNVELDVVRFQHDLLDIGAPSLTNTVRRIS